jgi:hypothetical protein
MMKSRTRFFLAALLLMDLDVRVSFFLRILDDDALTQAG